MNVLKAMLLAGCFLSYQAATAGAATIACLNGATLAAANGYGCDVAINPLLDPVDPIAEIDPEGGNLLVFFQLMVGELLSVQVAESTAAGTYAVTLNASTSGSAIVDGFFTAFGSGFQTLPDPGFGDVLVDVFAPGEISGALQFRASGIDGEDLASFISSVPTTPVPLPAAFSLLLFGVALLLGLGRVGRRSRFC